jgi:tetratricopeptide (TPR) repeat protein
MSTLDPTRKISRRHELREDKVVTFYARAAGLVEKNRGVVLAAGAVVVIVVVAIVGFSMLMAQRDQTAVERMAAAVRAWESGDYRTALDGSDTFMGLTAVIDEYGSTDTGNLAHYYAADAHFQLGEYDQALEHFRSYDKESNHLGAAALAGEAAILATRGEHEDAGDLYRRAATIFPSDVTSPMYLLRAGQSYEAAGNPGDARRAYETIRDEYPTAPEARDIAFFLARVGSGS